MSKNFSKDSDNQRAKGNNFRGNNKGKQRNSRRNTDFKASDCTTVASKSAKYAPGNDKAWYSKNPKILRDAASFSYYRPIGTRVPWDQILGQPADYKLNWLAASDSIPGICSIQLFPSIGIATGHNSPINVASVNVYSNTRYMNSGSKNYDNPDQTLYLVAMDSAYSCWNWIARLYGMAKTFSSQNYYMPRAYFAANNVDFDSVLENLSNLREFLNVTAAQLKAYCVPATMPYTVRHSWLYANIYKDANTDKAQQYMFVPGCFYRYDETSSPNGGQLVPVYVTYNNANEGDSPILKYADVLGIMSSLLDSLKYSEDIGVMSGDIKKAYGDANMYTVSGIDPDYSVVPTYNEEVLTQIHNLHQMVNKNGRLQNMNIRQDPNTNDLLYQPIFKRGSVIPFTGAFVNLPYADAEPADTMVATRLIATCSPSDTAQDLWKIDSCGSDWVGGLKIWYYASNEGKLSTQDEPLVLHHHTAFPMATISANRPDEIVPVLMTISLFSQFDWHPLLLLNKEKTAASGPYTDDIIGWIGDVNTYAVLSHDNLETLHTAALMSLLDVPAYGGNV